MKTRILFIGQEYWAEHLARGLVERFPADVVCRVLPARMSGGILRHLRALLLSNRVVRVGYTPARPPIRPAESEVSAAGTSVRSLAKRALFRFRFGRRLRRCVLFARMIRHMEPQLRETMLIESMYRMWPRYRPGARNFIYWTGTDVLRTAQRAERGEVSRYELRTINQASNIAGARHLATELADMGVSAIPVLFPGDKMVVPTDPPPFPHEFSVLSYLPGMAFGFYDGPTVMQAATRLPEVRFLVMANDGKDVDDAPSNVRFLGWVDDPSPFYAASTVVVRLVEHDAVGATVSEGLRFGRYVIYSQELPHTIRVAHGDVEGLVNAVAALQGRHARGELSVNLAGRTWAMDEFDVDRRFARLFEMLSV